MTDFLVCDLVSTGPARVVESTPEGCSACHVAVWIAPSGRELVRRLGLQIVCLECWMVLMLLARASGEDVELMDPEPEQREELEKRRRDYPPSSPGRA